MHFLFILLCIIYFFLGLKYDKEDKELEDKINIQRKKDKEKYKRLVRKFYTIKMNYIRYSQQDEEKKDRKREMDLSYKLVSLRNELADIRSKYNDNQVSKDFPEVK